jgi:hypothetical protein
MWIIIGIIFVGFFIFVSFKAQEQRNQEQMKLFKLDSKSLVEMLKKLKWRWDKDIKYPFYYSGFPAKFRANIRSISIKWKWFWWADLKISDAEFDDLWECITQGENVRVVAKNKEQIKLARYKAAKMLRRG